MEIETLRPMNDGILVRVDPATRPATPLILATDASRMDCVHDAWGSPIKVRWGKVMRCGPGARDPETGRRKPVAVNPGDWVSFAGLTKFEDDDYVLITERDVLVTEDGGQRHDN